MMPIEEIIYRDALMQKLLIFRSNGGSLNYGAGVYPVSISQPTGSEFDFSTDIFKRVHILDYALSTMAMGKFEAIKEQGIYITSVMQK